MATFDVLLPVKNGIAYLAESINSICSQTFTDWRLLVLDHGSTDGSRELAEAYGERDLRVQVLSFPEARGLADLLNRGLECADCRYLMRHDADDISYPNRMAIMRDAYRDMPDCIAIGGQADVIDGQGLSIGAMILPVGLQRVSVSSFFRNPVAHPAATLDFAAIRRMQIRYGVDFVHLLPPEQRLQVTGLAEDYYLFGQLALHGQCTNVADKLIKYRWHGANVGATKHRDQILLSVDISRYLVRCFCVLHDVPHFDPAPFCNLGDALLDVDGSVDFQAEFETMATALRAGFGSSNDVEREIAFRYVVSTRRDARLLWRYFNFKRRYVPDTSEKNAVKKWVKRHLPGKEIIKISSIGC